MITLKENRNVEKIGEFGQEAEFTIKSNAKSFRALIGTLYTDKVSAVLRELGANSTDAHIVVGKNDVPFDISLPSLFDPVLKIRDYGNSMSHEFMMTRYNQAFDSTKEDNNDENGCHGLGRLSALSMSDSYMITTYLDGIKRVYTVFISENGKPTISFLGEEETTEENGVLLDIAVDPKKASEFDSKAKQIFKFYSTKPNFINRDNFVIPELTYIISAKDGLWHLQGNGFTPQAQMGVYSYPIDIHAIPGLTPMQSQILNCGAIIKFDLGELDISLNREGLHYSTPTINSIKKKLDLIIPHIQPEIESNFLGKNIFEKLELNYSLFSSSGKLSEISGLAREVLKNIKIPQYLDLTGIKTIIFSYDNWKNRLKKYEPTELHYQDGFYYVVDKKSHLREKARKFLTDPANSGKKIIFFREEIPGSFNDFKKKYDFDLNTLPKSSTLDFDKNGGNGASKTSKYLYLQDHIYRRNQSQCWNTDDSFDAQNEVIYVERETYRFTGSNLIGFDSRTLRDNVDKFNHLTGKTIKVYGLTARQLKSKGKTWISFHDAFQQAIKDWQTLEEKKIASYKYFKSNYSDFPDSILDQLKICSKTLCAKIKKEYDSIKSEISGLDSDMAERSTLKISDKYEYTTKKLKEKYPLIFHVDYYAVKDKAVKEDLEDYITLKS